MGGPDPGLPVGRLSTLLCCQSRPLGVGRAPRPCLQTPSTVLRPPTPKHVQSPPHPRALTYFGVMAEGRPRYSPCGGSVNSPLLPACPHAGPGRPVQAPLLEPESIKRRNCAARLPRCPPPPRTPDCLVCPRGRGGSRDVSRKGGTEGGWLGRSRLSSQGQRSGSPWGQPWLQVRAAV